MSLQTKTRTQRDLGPQATLATERGPAGRTWRLAHRTWISVRTTRWLYAPIAAVLALGLFGLGTVVTRPRQPVAVLKSTTAPMEAKAGAAPTGVVSSGSASAGRSSAPDVAIAPAEPPVPVPPTQPGTFPPKVVKTADVQVQVRGGSFDTAWRRALDVASRYGGFVTNSQTQQTDDRISSGSFTLRVAAPKLDAALADLRRLGTLKSLTTSGNDISGQLVDLDARIHADEAEEAQLLDLLKQADKVSDILPIRSQIQNVQQDLDSLRTQKKAFNNQVDYATINATIFEPNAVPQPGPLTDSVIARAWRTAVSAGLTIVAGTLVVLGGLLPLALIALGVWALVTVARRRRV